MRKYQAHWEVLKKDSVIVIEITQEMDNAQLDIVFNQLKRAVQKEKYMDIHYKKKYPNAIMTADVDHATKRIRFNLDCKDINTLLEGI